MERHSSDNAWNPNSAAERRFTVQSSGSNLASSREQPNGHSPRLRTTGRPSSIDRWTHGREGKDSFTSPDSSQRPHLLAPPETIPTWSWSERRTKTYSPRTIKKGLLTRGCQPNTIIRVRTGLQSAKWFKTIASLMRLRASTLCWHKLQS